MVWLKDPEHKSQERQAHLRHAGPGRPAEAVRTAWESGWIYNPEDEERFSAALQLANADTLLVTGYLGIKLLGETFTWKRATTSLEPLRGGHAGAR